MQEYTAHLVHTKLHLKDNLNLQKIKDISKQKYPKYTPTKQIYPYTKTEYQYNPLTKTYELYPKKYPTPYYGTIKKPYNAYSPTKTTYTTKYIRKPKKYNIAKKYYFEPINNYDRISKYKPKESYYEQPKYKPQTPYKKYYSTNMQTIKPIEETKDKPRMETEKEKKKRRKEEKLKKYLQNLKRLQDPRYRFTGKAKYNFDINKFLRDRYGNIYF